MKKFLILTTDLEIGGTPSVVREVSTRLAARGHRLEVACLARRGPVGEEIERRGVRVTALNANGVYSVSVVPRLLRLIREREITTVYSLLVHANAVAAVASRFTRNVRYFQSIQTTQLRPRWHWPVQSVAALVAEKVIVPSQSVAEIAQSLADIPAAKIVVIPNAIDAESFNIPRVANTTRRARVGFIGRLDPIKRVPDLVEAAGLLRDDIDVEIYGEGADRGRIEATVARLGVSNVTLHGSVSGPHEALAGIDILVLPSEAEGFGLVLIEAMAAGVAVIGTDVPGIRDVVADGVNGLLVAVGSPEKLATAIARMWADQSLCARLVERARAEVRARFSWDAVIVEYERILGG